MIQTLYNVLEYNQDLVNAAIDKMMNELNILSELKPGMRVVIKPNLIMAKPTSVPATTHPVVIRAVALWLRKNGITDITLAESSGGPYLAEYMKTIYRVCGMNTLTDVLTLNDDFTSVPVHTKDGFKNHSFNIITPITKADYIINICKLKTHSMTGLSAGIKNLFGVIPGLEKPQLHYLCPDIEDFSNMLLELAQTVNPNLTIIDAIDAMEGNGPTGGTSHPLKLILGAKDFYTQDYFATTLMKLDSNNIVMVRQAIERGLAHPNQIELKGDPIPSDLTPFKIPDARKLDFSNFMPGKLGKLFAKFCSKVLKSLPKVDKAKCVGCAKCAESCPQKIIKIKNNKAVFPRKGCISCFCCQEMCPAKAISVKKALWDFTKVEPYYASSNYIELSWIILNKFVSEKNALFGMHCNFTVNSELDARIFFSFVKYLSISFKSTWQNRGGYLLTFYSNDSFDIVSYTATTKIPTSKGTYKGNPAKDGEITMTVTHQLSTTGSLEPVIDEDKYTAELTIEDGTLKLPLGFVIYTADPSSSLYSNYTFERQ